jgi:hypothetical protein
MSRLLQKGDNKRRIQSLLERRSEEDVQGSIQNAISYTGMLVN